MSYAALKLLHGPTGVDCCAAAFFTHSPASKEDSPGGSPQGERKSNWEGTSPGWESTPWKKGAAAGSQDHEVLPNLVISKANVLEIYHVRTAAEAEGSGRGGVMQGLGAAGLELAAEYRLHGHIEDLAVLPWRKDEGRSRGRDALVLTFRDAKVSVLQWDDPTCGVRTSSLHCFEGAKWQHLKHSLEKFPLPLLARADHQGRCAGVLLYEYQLLILKSHHAGLGIEEEDFSSPSGSQAAAIESSYFINLQSLDMQHVKDFVFLHGYVEPALLVLHEKEPTWAGRAALTRFTCTISALSLNTSAQQHPLIFSAQDLPYDAFALLAVPSPVGGVLVFATNTLHYYSQSSSCILALNDFASVPEGSPAPPRAKVDEELDSARATWLSADTALISTKTGALLVLHLVFDGRVVQRLELTPNKSSVLATCLCTLGRSFFFMGSRLADSQLVQFAADATSAAASRARDEEEVEDDSQPPPKRQRVVASEGTGLSAEELSLYTSSSPAQGVGIRRTYKFAVRDSLVNIGPIRDFAIAPRTGAEATSTINELVACSGHLKNGALSVLHQSVVPEEVVEVGLEGIQDMWTVYHRKGADVSSEAEEYHAYLVLSQQEGTVVLETGMELTEVTDRVEYHSQGSTVAVGNLFKRQRVVQVTTDKILLLDGATKTQELSLDEGSTALTAVIEEPYVGITTKQGSVQVAACDYTTQTLRFLTADFESEGVAACALYRDQSGWLGKAATEKLPPGTVYGLVARENGNLEIFSLPDFRTVYSVNDFANGASLLRDSEGRLASREGPSDTAPGGEALGLPKGDTPRVTQLVMETLSDKFGRPFLFALLSNGTCLCYHSFGHKGEGSESKGRLSNLRFLRRKVDGVEGNQGSKLIVYKNVGGMNGVFLCGKIPAWVMAVRERIRPHLQLADGPISAFTPLHNVNCSHGFIFATAEGSLKICFLPSAFNFDSDWSVRKVPLRATPHQVAYWPEAQAYAVAVSTPVLNPYSRPPATPPPTPEGDDEVADGSLYQNNKPMTGPVEVRTVVEDFEVRVLEAGGSWETKQRFPLEQCEHAVTLKLVQLKNTRTGQLQPLLAVGTAYMLGEDAPCRGRVLLYALTTDQPTQLQEVYGKDLKGAISALSSIQGYLLVAVGPKLVNHAWDGADLTPTAFWDAPLYVVSLSTVKNFILVADVHRSLYFVLWKEEGKQLSLLAKDFGAMDCLAAEFLIDGQTLSLVASDRNRNLQVFSYAPKSLESWKGQKLLLRMQIHQGAHIAKLLRVQLVPHASSSKANRFAVLFGTFDGAIGTLAPIDELTFKRLQALQRRLVEAVPHTAGLNPRAFRQCKAKGQPSSAASDNVVDSELLYQFELLSQEQQSGIARQIGTTPQMVISNLRDLTATTSLF